MVLYQDYRSVVRLGKTCKLLNALAKDEAVWKALVCQNYDAAAMLFVNRAKLRERCVACSWLNIDKHWEEMSSDGEEKKSDWIDELGSFEGLFFEQAFLCHTDPSLCTSSTWREVFRSEDHWQAELKNLLGYEHSFIIEIPEETYEELYHSEIEGWRSDYSYASESVRNMVDDYPSD